jgi:hypothetical protein
MCINCPLSLTRSGQYRMFETRSSKDAPNSAPRDPYNSARMRGAEFCRLKAMLEYNLITTIKRIVTTRKQALNFGGVATSIGV